MIVEKRINNNVVLAIEQEQQVIVMGKGIGFQVYPNEVIDEKNIQNKFYPVSNMSIAQMAALITDATAEMVDAINEIIETGKKHLSHALNPNIFFTLLDHISFAVKRQVQGMDIISPLEWEIKKFYVREYEIGKEALQIIQKHLKQKLADSEAVFIALHFVNAQLELGSNSELVEMTEITSEIVKFVKYHYQCDFDMDSVVYHRFITHLRYYLMRQIKGEQVASSNNGLVDTVKIKYEEDYQCVEKIAAHLHERFGWNTSEVEKMYLVLHIRNLITKNE